MADKVDISFKKIIGREYTSTEKEWYEEFPIKPFNLFAGDVWFEEIPSTPPSSSTNHIEVYDKLLLQRDYSVNYNKCWVAEHPIGVRVGNFIPPRYGQGYTVRVYDGNDNEIFTTDESGWFFDYTSGILTFENDPSDYGWDTSVFKIKAYRYIGSTVADIITGSGILSASDIINDSTVSGVTVKDALEELSGAVAVSKFKYNQSLNVVSGTRIYSLPDTPIEETVQIFVNGLLQEPGIGNDYIISGQLVTFSQDLEFDDVLLANYIIP